MDERSIVSGVGRGGGGFGEKKSLEATGYTRRIASLPPRLARQREIDRFEIKGCQYLADGMPSNGDGAAKKDGREGSNYCVAQSKMVLVDTQELRRPSVGNIADRLNMGRVRGKDHNADLFRSKGMTLLNNDIKEGGIINIKPKIKRLTNSESRGIVAIGSEARSGETSTAEEIQSVAKSPKTGQKKPLQEPSHDSDNLSVLVNQKTVLEVESRVRFSPKDRTKSLNGTENLARLESRVSTLELEAEIQSRLRHLTLMRGEVQEPRNRSNRGSSTCFSSSPSAGEEVFMSDEEDVNSLSTEPEDEFSPKIQMLKLRFDEEKRRLEVEASQRNKFAVQEWMRELSKKSRLKKEREMEKMEKERLLKELQMMNFEQRRCAREQELIKEEQHQRGIQDRMHQEQKIRELEELAKTLEEDKIKRKQMHETLSKKAPEYHHREWNDPKQGRVEVDLEKIMKEESASQKMHCTEVVPKSGNDMQGKTVSLGVCSYPGQSEAERRLPSLDLLELDQDIVEEQRRILETILNERKQEELNEELAWSLCSGPQVPQPLARPQPRPQLGEDGQPPTCQRRSEGQKAQGNVNVGFSGWEKVVRRQKHSKSESQSSLNEDSKTADEFLLASRLKEREEQARRSSRNSTHQKVLLVPDFTEAASGGSPSRNKKEQDPVVLQVATK